MREEGWEIVNVLQARQIAHAFMTTAYGLDHGSEFALRRQQRRHQQWELEFSVVEYGHKGLFNRRKRLRELSLLVVLDAGKGEVTYCGDPDGWIDD